MEYRELKSLLDRNLHRIKTIGMHHEKITELRRLLHDGGGQSGMDFAVEGMWGQQKLLTAGLRIKAFIICPECIYSIEGVQLAEKMIVSAEEVYTVSKKVMEKLSGRDKPDGFITIAELQEYGERGLILPDRALVIVLDGLESPGNIGTILRSCDGAGVDAVLLCNTNVRITHPKLIKASMGAVFRVPAVYFSEAEQCVKWLTSRDYQIYLADSAAEDGYTSISYGNNTAIVVGNERYGLSEIWYDPRPRLVSIPMHGLCDSLNVGVAASILAYTVVQQRK